MPDTARQRRTRMLKRMITIRRFEERVKELYHAGEIVGAIHLYIGEEAVAVGACEALRDDDFVTSTHRSHGHTIAKIFDLERTMAEMMGRETGLSRGRGGSMHMFDIKKGFLGGNGIVGGGIGIALGAAFSAKYRETDQVALCFFSEGAANQGVLCECLNMAALWRMPVIFLLENNRYAATTPVEKSACTVNIAPRAGGYGIPWSVVDGNDVEAVYAAAAEAVTRARAGDGAAFIECKTYRIEPHCGIIPDARDKSEIDEWRSASGDPIKRFTARLAEEGVLTQEEIEALRSEVESELDEAIDFARNSPWPAVEAVAEGLYSA